PSLGSAIRRGACAQLRHSGHDQLRPDLQQSIADGNVDGPPVAAKPNSLDDSRGYGGRARPRGVPARTAKHVLLRAAPQRRSVCLPPRGRWNVRRRIRRKAADGEEMEVLIESKQSSNRPPPVSWSRRTATLNGVRQALQGLVAMPAVDAINHGKMMPSSSRTTQPPARTGGICTLVILIAFSPLLGCPVRKSQGSVRDAIETQDRD